MKSNRNDVDDCSLQIKSKMMKPISIISMFINFKAIKL